MHSRDLSNIRKTGLRIIGRRGHPEVRGALIRYARWLRLHYDFPVRVPVYLSQHPQILNSEGEFISASFMGPFDPNEDPYVRIATGDYEDQLNEFGRDSALAANLHSLSHELIHYWQWLDTGTITERGVIVRAQNMVSKYSLDVDHP